MTVSSKIRILIAAGVICGALAVTGSATAGSYAVSACSPGFPNNSWSNEVVAGNFDFENNCANGGSYINGQNVDTTGALVVWTQLGAMAAPAAGFLRFDAPSGTTIASVTMNRQLQVFNDDFWRAKIETNNGELEGCQLTPAVSACGLPGTGGSPGPVNLTNLNANWIRVGASCTSPCSGGGAYRSATGIVRGISVVLTDNTAPTANDLSGALVAGGTLSGTKSLTVSGSDLSGIKKLQLLIDGQLAGEKLGTCDYSQKRPCAVISPSLSHTFNVNTDALTSGGHVITARVFDTADNMTTKTANINVVGSIPPPATPPAPAPPAAPTPRNSYLRITSTRLTGKTLRVAGLIHSQASGKITVKVTYRDSKRKLRSKTYTASKSGQKWLVSRSFSAKRATIAVTFSGNSPWISTSAVKSHSAKKSRRR